MRVQHLSVETRNSQELGERHNGCEQVGADLGVCLLILAVTASDEKTKSLVETDDAYILDADLPAKDSKAVTSTKTGTSTRLFTGNTAIDSAVVGLGVVSLGPCLWESCLRKRINVIQGDGGTLHLLGSCQASLAMEVITVLPLLTISNINSSRDTVNQTQDITQIMGTNSRTLDINSQIQDTIHKTLGTNSQTQDTNNLIQGIVHKTKDTNSQTQGINNLIQDTVHKTLGTSNQTQDIVHKTKDINSRTPHHTTMGTSQTEAIRVGSLRPVLTNQPQLLSPQDSGQFTTKLHSAKQASHIILVF
eukprot:TRINITY_DN4128_c0_g1_i4.p1 TRINITY_DN4128_c0_g1~~TRINITY_DN4128_c0_g1_i4.p1  ORF type:complete len:305 (-),score=49.37 TRINITY_DN4128_c0_g1_i4:182-1096(-)